MPRHVISILGCTLLFLLACGEDPAQDVLPAAGSGGASGDGDGTGGSDGTGGLPGGDGDGTAGDGDSAGDGDGDGAGAGGAGDGDGPAGPETGPFAPVDDFFAAGPYGSTTLPNVGPGSNYTVYLPEQLAPDGARNPIVAWTSGGSTSHTGYTLLPHLASHGFVVISSNTVPGIGAEVALGDEMVAGIDWLVAENGRDGSDLYDKLDTGKVAASGYSMGSLATFTMAMDARLTTTLHISGGNMAPDRVFNLHAPAAFICGIPGDASCNILSTSCDIAAANCDTDFEMATTPVFYANFPSGHLGILTPPFTERINAMATAWLRYQLMLDRTLRTLFVGDSCDYCTDPDWSVQQKNL